MGEGSSVEVTAGGQRRLQCARYDINALQARCAWPTTTEASWVWGLVCVPIGCKCTQGAEGKLRICWLTVLIAGSSSQGAATCCSGCCGHC
jgi:hypothetical protein